MSDESVQAVHATCCMANFAYTAPLCACAFIRASQVEARLGYWEAAEALVSRAMRIFHERQPTDEESRNCLIECTKFYSDEVIHNEKVMAQKENAEEELAANGGKRWFNHLLYTHHPMHALVRYCELKIRHERHLLHTRYI